MSGWSESGIGTFIDNPDKTIRIPSYAVVLIAKTISGKDFREQR